jgi:hypothetical protein
VSGVGGRVVKEGGGLARLRATSNGPRPSGAGGTVSLG